MNLPDKLPTLDPNVRGIYDVLIAAAVEVRQQRKTDEYSQAEQRREKAAIALRELRERERQEIEAEERAELFRQQQAIKESKEFIPFRPGRAFLSLRGD